MLTNSLHFTNPLKWNIWDKDKNLGLFSGLSQGLGVHLFSDFRNMKCSWARVLKCHLLSVTCCHFKQSNMSYYFLPTGLVRFSISIFVSQTRKNICMKIHHKTVTTLQRSFKVHLIISKIKSISLKTLLPISSHNCMGEKGRLSWFQKPGYHCKI